MKLWIRKATWEHTDSFQAVVLRTVLFILAFWARKGGDTSVDQVFQFGVDQREHDGAGAVQDGSALEQSSGFGAPRLRLEIEVDGVKSHSKEVSNQSHGFRVQPGGVGVERKTMDMCNTSYD